MRSVDLDKVLKDRLTAEIRTLIVGRTIGEAIELLVEINAGLAAEQHAQAAAEMMSVH